MSRSLAPEFREQHAYVLHYSFKSCYISFRKNLLFSGSLLLSGSSCMFVFVYLHISLCSPHLYSFVGFMLSLHIDLQCFLLFSPNDLCFLSECSYICSFFFFFKKKKHKFTACGHWHQVLPSSFVVMWRHLTAFYPLLFFNELLFFLLKPRHCYGKNNNLRFKYKILRLKGPKISKWRIFGLVWIFLREFETPIILFYFILVILL